MLRTSSEHIPPYGQGDQTLEKYCKPCKPVSRLANPGPNRIGGSTFGAWEWTGLGSPFRCSYGFNGWYFFDPRNMTPFTIFRRDLDTFSVRGSANIPVFLDATLYASKPECNDRPPGRERHDGSFNMRTYCVNRHNGYTNGLFLDWSVRKIGLKELWTLKWEPWFNTVNEWTKAGGVQPEDWPKWMRNFKDY